MIKYKLFLVILLIFCLSLVPITSFHNVSLVVSLSTHANMARLAQRFLGLTLFILLFFQLVLGSFMDFWEKKVGRWIFNYHILEGTVIYGLVIFHTLSFLFYNYFLGKGFDPFYVYTQFCLLCQTSTELFYTFGRISFWLISGTVFAGLFRAATPFMRKNWRKFHAANYAIFILVGIHAYFSGTDFYTFPYIAFAAPAYLVVVWIIFFKEIPKLHEKFKLWIRR